MSSSAPTDVLSDLATGWAEAMQRWWDDSSSAVRTLQRSWTAEPRDRQKDCGCADSHDACGCGDPCSCCIPQADIVLHARAGERRVLAFSLRNSRHREREVSLEVGPWHLCSDEPVEVQARFDVDSALTLQGCESTVVRLLVAVSAGKDGEQRDPLGDVQSCASAYADIRFEGCARPQRVAVVVHPASCDAVDVTCDCGCC
jgi:hypothetical protein